mmetsp:Transcript_66965/g.195773  ORF Transcript_66965/g.195773 Transcript_66965/m.195773 type:complete len:123 (+) Transcript_66965:472-840(+)
MEAICCPIPPCSGTDASCCGPPCMGPVRFQVAVGPEDCIMEEPVSIDDIMADIDLMSPEAGGTFRAGGAMACAGGSVSVGSGGAMGHSFAEVHVCVGLDALPMAGRDNLATQMLPHELGPRA